MLYPFTKRLFDIVCASLGLLFLLPLGLLIALLIKLSDRGPIFYAQTRIGQFGRPFRIWKFRSMILNADQLGLPLTGDADPRITRVGRFLRKTKLDELPQLWNVLVGDMSFVGPRPEVPRYVDLYTPDQREILRYKPGITDLASLLFRNEEELLRGADDVEQFYIRYCLPKKIELNRQHAERASLFQDISIILQTLSSLLPRRSHLSALRPDLRPVTSDLRPPPCDLRPPTSDLRPPTSDLRPPTSDLRPLTSGSDLRPPTSDLRPQSSIPGSSFQVSGLIPHPSTPASSPPSRVAIIGTGDLATKLALELNRSNDPARQVVAFFDDNPRAWHKRPHDIPVIGMPECLLNKEWLDRIDEVIIALPEDNSVRLQEIRALLKPLPLKVTSASSSNSNLPTSRFPL